MQTKSQTPLYGPITPQTNTESPLPDPVRQEAPPPTSVTEDVKKSNLDKAVGVGHVIANSVQKGLDYANARRARAAAALDAM